MTGGQTIESASGTQAVDRAASLLTMVVEADAPVTFAELSEASGLARSTQRKASPMSPAWSATLKR